MNLLLRSGELGELSRYSDWLQAGQPRDLSSSPGRSKIFLLSKWSRPTLGPTEPSIQWVLGALSPGVKRRDVKLTTHLQLVPRSRLVHLYLRSAIHLHVSV
jgi:hypothetical protein